MIRGGMAYETSDKGGTDWRDLAECQNHDAELFFPIGETGAYVRQIEAAKDVCFTCPVRERCLEWAMDTREPAGIWGGTTEQERDRERRRLGRVRAAGRVAGQKNGPMGGEY